MLSGCNATTGESAASKPASAAAEGATAATGVQVVSAQAVTTPDVSGYRIGASDTLEVSVFQVPDLTRTVRVGDNGQISLPLIGNVPAAGKTADELRTAVAARYGSKYLQNPQVDVVVKDFASQRVTVEGSVTKPGIYPVGSSTSLMQAVAMAGGLDRAANSKAILVFRTNNNQRTAAKFDYTAIRAGSAPDPVLVAGDVVVVDQSGTRAAFKTVLEALPLVGVFGAVLGH